MQGAATWFHKLRKTLRIAWPMLAMLLLWEAIARSGWVSAYLLPKPLTVAATAWQLFQEGVLLTHTKASLTRIAIGFFISCSTGILLAGATVRFRWLADSTTAVLGLLRMIPPLALTPLLILWLGIGNATQISIIVLASFFPVFLNAASGFRHITPELDELARSLALPRMRYVSHIALPAAVPALVTGLRLGFGYSWRALIGAELIAASSGLGYLILDAQELQRTDVVIVGILVIGLLGWGMDWLFQRTATLFLGRRFPEVAA
ncbi:MAG: ABC transporter permease [Brachymonas sp.]|nr:ABC transporter permease [Brachymonas sp.]